MTSALIGLAVGLLLLVTGLALAAVVVGGRS